MFDAIAPTYDLLNSVLSGGMHRIWERALVASVPVSPTGRCLDLCTGTGALVPRLAKKFQAVVGADISPQMLQVARSRFRALSHVEWVEADAQQLPFDDASFDCLTISYGIRNVPNLELGLSEIRRVVKPGGTIAILEFGTPRNSIWRGLFSLYSRCIIPFVGGMFSGQRGAYEYLPTTAAAFPYGDAFEGLLAKAGLTPQKTRRLMGGVAYIYVAARSGNGGSR
jgi:demethylmenaquinone methyltransferase/2-methoxy-6-polyprenyl-1,4-benzoquinol methylase